MAQTGVTLFYTINPFGPSAGCVFIGTNINVSLVEGEVHDFYKTSWFVEFEALSRMVKVRGSCDKPFKRYSRLKLTIGPVPRT